MRVPEFLGEADRYKIEREIARGGMGAVYRAYDKNTAQWVAIKIMLDSSNPDAQALFDKEWRILAELQHPNIIGITDRGEFWDGNTKFPYFVMPFLRGKTLQECIQNEKEPLTVERVVSIVTAAADSLNAAHSRGVIHRDVKPSNIFVLDAGPVVVIDFGVVHLADNRPGTTVKGTTPYMAPELLVPKKHEKPSPSSDLFSLGVVCYEALTSKQPFARQSTQETVEAILQEIPIPAYEMNRKVSLLLSQVVQKAMAKDRTHRFGSVKEFADKLERAFRSELLPEFDRGTIEERLRVVRDALAKGQTTSAHMLLRSIEEDGLVDPAITSQRQKIDQAIVQKQIREQIESARVYREAKQYIAAIERLNEVLAVAPDNVEALTEMESIDQERVRATLNEARLLIQNHRFDDARRTIEDARSIRPRHTQTSELMAELARMEEADRQLAEQKATLYQEAQDANRDGRLRTAFEKLEQVMELIRQGGPRSNSERDPIYKNFYEVVLEEYGRIEKADQEIRGHMAEGRFAQAVELCDQVLATNPGQPRFEVLKLEAESRERESRLEYVNKVRASLRDVPDFDVRLTMLQEAVDRYPNEAQLIELLKIARSKRDVINGLLAKARKAESSGRYAECLDHWKTLRECHPMFPSVDTEIERVKELQTNEVRAVKKAVFAREISKFLRAGEYQRASDCCKTSLEAFPGDAELLALQRAAEEGEQRAPEVQTLIADGRSKLHEGRTDEALESLRRAVSLDPVNLQVRQFLGIALLEKIRSGSPDNSDNLLREAQEMIPDHPDVKSLATQILERKRNTAIEQTLAIAQELGATGDHAGAVAKLDETLRVYPGERRLTMERNKYLQHLGEPAPRESEVVGGGKQSPESRINDSVAPTGISGMPSTQAPLPQPGLAETADASSEEPRPSVFDKLRLAFQSSVTAGQNWARSVMDRVKESRETQGVADGGERQTTPRLPYRKIAAIAGGLAVVIVAGIAYTATRPDPPKPLPPPVTLKITATPSDAEIIFDNEAAVVSNFEREFQFAADAPVETRKISVSRLGYVTQELEIPLAESKNVPVFLEPIPLELRIISDQAPKQVLLDDQPVELTPEGLLIGGIKPGVHPLKIETASGTIETSFNFQAGGLPRPFLPVLVQGAPTVLFIGGFDGKIRPECNCRPATLKINDATLAMEPDAEMSLADGDQSAELVLPSGTKKLSVASSKSPTAIVAVYWPKTQPPTPTPDGELLRRARAAIDAALREKSSAAFNRLLNQAENFVQQVVSRTPDNQEAVVLQRQIVRLRAIGPQ